MLRIRRKGQVLSPYPPLFIYLHDGVYCITFSELMQVIARVPLYLDMASELHGFISILSIIRTASLI